jgi:hypothetical protein
MRKWIRWDKPETKWSTLLQIEKTFEKVLRIELVYVQNTGMTIK